jgi:hypothetical protein
LLFIRPESMFVYPIHSSLIAKNRLF